MDSVKKFMDAHKDKLGAMAGYGQPGYGQAAPAGYAGQQATPGGYPNQQMAPAGYPTQHAAPPHQGQGGYGSQPVPQQPTPVTVNIVSSGPGAGSGYPPTSGSAPHGYPPTSAPQGYPSQTPSPYGNSSQAPQAYPQQASNPYGAAPNPYGAAATCPNPYGAPPSSNPYGAPPSYGAAPPNPYGAPSYGAQGGYPPSSNIFGTPPSNPYPPPQNPYNQGPSI